LRWPASGLSLVLLLLALGAPPQAAAQDALEAAAREEARTVTFDVAINLALNQNTDLRRAALDVDRLDATINAEWFDFSPDLSLSAFGQRQFGRNFNQEQGQIVNQVNDVFGSSATASIRVFDGFANVASLKAAQRRGQAGDLTVERTRQDVVFTVMQQFITLVQNREIVEVRREQLETQREQLEQIRAFVEAGSRPQPELFQQRAAVAQAESQLLQAQRDVQLAETRIIQTLQLDPLENYDFEAPALDDERPLSGPQYDLRQVLQMALDRRADLKAQRAQVQAAEQEVRVARSSYWPSLDVSLNYGSNWASTARLPIPGSGEPPEVVQVEAQDGTLVSVPVPGTGQSTQFTQPSFFDQLDNRRGGSMTARLSVPIFNRFDRRVQMEQAQVQARTAELNLADQRQQVGLEVRQAYLDYRTAEKQLEVTQVQFESARLARDAAEERYNLGAAPFVELAQANADFVQAASNRVQARYDFILQQRRIDYLRGTLDPREPLLGN
jgi:outer membrane protein